MPTAGKKSTASKKRYYLVGYGEVSPETYALNPHLHPTPTKRNRQVLRLVDDQALLEMTQLAQDFYTQWTFLGGPQLHTEYMFHDVRDWQFDFIHWPTRVALEVEGGVWLSEHGKKSRHLTPQGYTNDCIKYNHGIYFGYQPLRFTTDMISAEHIEPAIEHVRRLMAHNDVCTDTP